MATTTPAQRKPKARLKNMTVGEVSLVDLPANEQPFVVVKSEGEPAPSAPPTAPEGASAAEEEKADPMLGTDAKQPLLDEIGACLEELSALAATVSETPTQDGAGVPLEFAEMMRNSAARLIAVADQFAPPAAAEAPEAPKEAAAGPASGAAPEAAAVSLDAAAVEQALENVLVRYGIKKPDEMAKSAESTKSITDKLDHVLALQQATLARATIGSIAKAAQAPNSAPIDTPPPAPEAKRVSWPSDLSAEVLADKAAAKSAS